MSSPFSFGEIRLDVSAGRDPQPPKPSSDTPFRIAVLGDFSGRASRGVAKPEAPLRPRLIDRDNLDQVFSQLAPRIEFNLHEGGPRLSLSFSQLDDFDPDRIFERAGFFRAMRAARKKLADPDSFPKAARDLGLLPGGAAEPARPQAAAAAAPSPAPDPASFASGSLLDQALEQTEAAAGKEGDAPAGARDPMSAFLRDIVAPYAEAASDPRQEQVLEYWDAAIGEQMRNLFRNPAFQALEAAWRGLFFLVDRLETGPELKIYLIDVSKTELARSLSGGDLAATPLYKTLVSETVETPGGRPWAVIAGAYRISATEADAVLLGRIAKICARAGAPFLAEADGRLAGAESLARTPDPGDWRFAMESAGTAAWEALRELPEAAYAGLLLPRFLLRLPYGRDTVPTEELAFEEMPDPSEHEAYLWGNPAFAAALLLGESFTNSGWRMRPGERKRVDGLPLSVYKEGGESQVKPCAEVLLTERAAEAVLERGPMPLLSVRGMDQAILARFQSVRRPPQALAGPWSA